MLPRPRRRAGARDSDPTHRMSESDPGGSRPTFRVTLVRVMAVQVLSLVILWLLQVRYHG